MQSMFVFVLSLINFFLPCIVSDDQYRDYTWEKPLINQCSSMKKYNRMISDVSVSDGVKTYYSMYYASRMGIAFPIKQSNWKETRRWFKESAKRMTDDKKSIPTENIINKIYLLKSKEETRKLEICERKHLDNIRLLSQANYRLIKGNNSRKYLLKSSKSVKPSLYNLDQRNITAHTMKWMEIRRIGRPDTHLSFSHKLYQGKDFL